MHGEAGVTVGSGGYRSGYVRSDIPVGQTGTVSIAVGETKFGSHYLPGRFGPGGYRSLGLGLALGGAALDPSGVRCLRAGEAGADLGHDPRIEGGRPSPCPTAGGPSGPP
jgi:hypothetical protein